MTKKNRKSRERSVQVPRDPYPEVKQFLRQEVNYACPVPGCGSPLLEWHHFDPIWKEKHHHNCDGMIALCTSCHPKADRGTWTKEELRSFKRNPVPRGLIRETFGWSERSVLYRLGGCYATDCRAGALAHNGQRILWDERSAEGRLLFSLDLFGEKGQHILHVRQNCLSVDASSIWDLSLNAGATHFKLWLGERKPGIELQFRRLSIEELRDLMTKDLQNGAAAAEKVFADSPWRDHLRRPHAQEPKDGNLLLDYVISNCVDCDGNVTLIDIAQARFSAPNSILHVTDTGIRFSVGSQWVACNSFNSDGYGFNL